MNVATRPQVQVLGPGAVLLTDDALLVVHRLALLAQRVSAGDGVHEPREVREVHNAVREALAWAAEARKIARSAEADSAESLPMEISTAEASRLLDVTPRTIQHRAGQLSGRRGAGGELVFDRATVVAVANSRKKGTRWPRA